MNEHDPRHFDLVVRHDLASFIQKAFATVVPGEVYQDNWHVHAMACELEKCLHGETKRLIMTLPPRYMKSLTTSVAFPAYVLGHDPTRKIICVSYSHDLAAALARGTREIMESE
jgi:hypothetical protein